ncbi:MAG: DUF2284 domain-containing protein [candidate division WOR-3 bacterium]|nr:DUF2284 domain-containing protein [candidate division WOR-3 bacterium]
MLKEYKSALFFTYHINQPQERKQRQAIRKFLAKLERQVFLDGYYKALVLGAGPCNLCAKCDITKTCRHSEIARPSLEACGIDVYQTARNLGINLQVVRNFDEIPTYCCLLLIE